MPLTVSIRLEEWNTSHVFRIEFRLLRFKILNDGIQMFFRKIDAFGIEVVGIRELRDTIIMRVVIPIMADYENSYNCKTFYNYVYSYSSLMNSSAISFIYKYERTLGVL